jgi:Sulphur transport
VATVVDSIAPARSHRARLRVSATTTGVVGALLAVVAGSLFDVRPPDAYGICMACHARDLVNWSINAAAGTGLTIAPASLVFPVLTPVGVLLGALIAARASNEFRWQRPEHPLKTFLYGVIVMNCALLAGGCSIRLLLRTSAGEPLGMIGFGALAAGVILATQWLRWRATR